MNFIKTGGRIREKLRIYSGYIFGKVLYTSSSNQKNTYLYNKYNFPGRQIFICLLYHNHYHTNYLALNNAVYYVLEV